MPAEMKQTNTLSVNHCRQQNTGVTITIKNFEVCYVNLMENLMKDKKKVGENTRQNRYMQVPSSVLFRLCEPNFYVLCRISNRGEKKYNEFSSVIVQRVITKPFKTLR